MKKYIFCFAIGTEYYIMYLDLFISLPIEMFQSQLRRIRDSFSDLNLSYETNISYIISMKIVR